MSPKLRWCLVLAVLAVTGGTLLHLANEALDIERREQAVRIEAAQLEARRTALWRMDSYLAPHIADESAYVLSEAETFTAALSDGAADADWPIERRLVSPVTNPQEHAALRTKAAIGRFAPTDYLIAQTPSNQDLSFRAQANFQNQAIVQRQTKRFLPIDTSTIPNGQQTTPTLVRPFWANGALNIAAANSAAPDSTIRLARINSKILFSHLTSLVQDITPGAQLEQVDDVSSDTTNLLAAIPARLVWHPPQLPASSRLRPLVFITLGTAFVSATMLVVLLSAALRLSDRRRQFVSAVTHELRTPLTTFRLYSEMLRDNLVPSSEQLRYYDTMAREAARLATLVENVLAFSRLENRRLSLTDAVNARDLLQQVLPTATHRVQQTDRALECVLAPDLQDWHLCTNVAAVEQIVMNLVDNACKFAPSGPLQLHVHTAGSTLCITLADQGPGMPLRRGGAFSVSSEEAAQRQKPGVGLGLDLCQRLARVLGGKLILERNKPQGCRACLMLPAQHRAGTARDDTPGA